MRRGRTESKTEISGTGNKETVIECKTGSDLQVCESQRRKKKGQSTTGKEVRMEGRL